jgi:type IX secretion system PorP/SprF family membrane protein
MFNTQLFNAGYVGASQAHTFNLLQRKQWVGFDGAPVSQSLSYGTPVNQKRLAYGFSAINDKIGPLRNNSFAADVAYHLLLNGSNKVLSLGLKLSLNSFNLNSDELNLNQIQDPLFLSESIGFKPNIGTGIYYYTDKFYAGVSTPYFFENKELGQKRHIYFTSGLLINLFRDVQLRPSTLIKMTKGVPVNLDLSTLLIFKDQFWLGGNLRSTYKDLFPTADTGGGFGGIFGINLSDSIMVSYAYSYSLGNRTGVFNNGTHEIILRYNLRKAVNALIDSPRYF